MEHTSSAILRQLMCICFILMVLFSYYSGNENLQFKTETENYGMTHTETIKRTEPKARPPTKLYNPLLSKPKEKNKQPVVF